MARGRDTQRSQAFDTANAIWRTRLCAVLTAPTQLNSRASREELQWSQAVRLPPCACYAPVVTLCCTLREYNFRFQLRCLRTGTRGIGYGIANCLARDGYDLLLGYNANAERAATVRPGLHLTGLRTYVREDAEQHNLTANRTCASVVAEGPSEALLQAIPVPLTVTHAPPSQRFQPRRGVSGAQAARDLEQRHGVRVATWAGELAKLETLERAFEVVQSEFGGRLTAFVHNAGASVS